MSVVDYSWNIPHEEQQALRHKWVKHHQRCTELAAEKVNILEAKLKVCEDRIKELEKPFNEIEKIIVYETKPLEAVKEVQSDNEIILNLQNELKAINPYTGCKCKFYADKLAL